MKKILEKTPEIVFAFIMFAIGLLFLWLPSCGLEACGEINAMPIPLRLFLYIIGVVVMVMGIYLIITIFTDDE